MNLGLFVPYPEAPSARWRVLHAVTLSRMVRSRFVTETRLRREVGTTPTVIQELSFFGMIEPADLPDTRHCWRLSKDGRRIAIASTGADEDALLTLPRNSPLVLYWLLERPELFRGAIYREIEKLTGLSNNTIGRHLGDLAAAGLIIRHPGDRGWDYTPRGRELFAPDRPPCLNGRAATTETVADLR